MDEELSPGADDVMATLMALPGMDDDDAPEAAAPESAEGEEPAGDAAPETASGDEPTETEQPADEGAVEAAEPPIELPASFPAELREHLKGLPPDAQRAIAQFEAERTKGVNQKLEETATLRKQLEPERQRLAQQLDAAISLTQNFDPILAEGLKRTPADWAKLANEDPAGYVQQKAAFEAKLGSLNQAVAERQRIAQENHGQIVQREQAALVEALPELKDPVKAKAFAADMSSSLQVYGFTPQEIESVVDHRMVKVLADAMKYRKGEAARTAAAAKVAKPSVPKVVKPGSGDATPTNARSKALTNKAINATSTYDQAAALAAMLD